MVGQQRPEIIVIGCGVTGLSTALRLAQVGYPVQVWARDPPEHTTSVVASAFWGPHLAGSEPRTLAWSERSLHHFRDLAQVPGSGVRMVSLLTIDSELTGPHLTRAAALLPDLQHTQLDQWPGDTRPAARTTVPLIDMPRYLDHLRTTLSELGVHIEQRTIASLREPAREAPYVVNCTGLDAHTLIEDDRLTPVFGQHVVLTNPSLDEAFLERAATSDEWTSYFPHPQRVVCGGIRIPGRWDTNPDPDISTRILDRCRHIQPLLHDARVIDVVAGLRPYRPTIRVDIQQLDATTLIHNYGHGSHGVTLSWGCAHTVLSLVEVRSATNTLQPPGDRR